MMDFTRPMQAAALLVVCFYCVCPADELFVAFWNVENLFDTADDRAVEGDEEFTPSGPKQWTPQRLQIKLRNLSRVIGDMNGGKGPDVLGLCEVENRDVLEALVDTIALPSRDYAIIHHDSPSGRGIDCALLYDRRRAKLAGAPYFYRVDVPDPTREIVEALLNVSGNRLTVFVNHWPSRRNPEEQRIAAADRLRGRVDQILDADPRADFVIMGDLNDFPVDKSVGTHLRTWSDPDDLRPGVLFNSMWQIFQDPNRGTYVYANRWNVLDHMILSPGLLDQSGFRWRRGSTDVVQKEYQMFHPDAPSQIARPSRSYSWNSFHADGYSDHLPVKCVLEF